MSFYRQNREVLEQRFPGISEKLDTDVLDSEGLEILKSRDEQLTVRYKKSWLHSRHAPLKEAERLIESSIPEDCPYCLFYGFGLAYHLEEFVRKHPGVPFAVVEPDAALFNACLDLRDLTDIFMNPDFSFALSASPDAMPGLLENTMTRDIQICMLRPAVNNNRDYFDSVEKVIKEFLARKEINVHTLNKFSRLWVSNICTNLPLNLRCPGVKTLQNSFEGTEVLLLAAGPTLSRILPILPELRKRMLLVCVDTALKACLRMEIEPDFLILTDPQYWNSRHLDRCRISGCILISDVSTYPAALRINPGKTFFCSTPFPLGEFFESRTEIKGKLKSGGSVATAAWDFIRQIGADNIYCSGLDLSFPYGETHYRGSTFEERLHSLSSRTSSIESSSWLALLGGNPYKGKNRKGETVLSDQRMKIYIHWFEEQMKQHPEIRTVQLSPEGIMIEGMEWQEMDSLIELPECRDRIDSRMKELHKIQSGSTEQDLKGAHNEVLRELTELINLTGEAADLSIKLMNTEDPLENQTMLRELNNIDSAILNRESREMAGFILAPILEEHMNRKAVSRSDILENSKTLYTELRLNLIFHKEKISRIIL
jgi:hypothetical protein